MKWSDDDDDILIKYAQKKTAAEIGIILDRSTTAVYSYARRKGITLTKTGEAHYKAVVSDVQRLAIQVMHDAGMTPRQCAMVINGQPSVSANTIKNICKG